MTHGKHPPAQVDDLVEDLREQLEKTFTGQDAGPLPLDMAPGNRTLLERVRALEAELAMKDRELENLRSNLGLAQPLSGRAEHRQYQRYLVNWRVAIINEGGGQRDIYYGRANDVSLGGVSVHSDINLQFSRDVAVLLCIPPLAAGSKPTIVEAHSRVIYTVLSVSVDQFRIGVQFLKFKGHGKRVLESHLRHLNAYF